jgi:hypothetical protein
MQAIKYAAMVSRFTTEALAEHHARFCTARGKETSTDEALSDLQAHAPDLSNKTLRQPRIVLLAREYPMAVTASAVWLSEVGLDITLVQFKAYEATAPDDHGGSNTQVLISVSQLYPVRDVEEFMVRPQRIEAQEAAGRIWDEESYLKAAQDQFTEEEAAFIKQLLGDVDNRGVNLGWGRRASPNVSGHYYVGGIDTPVWIMNLSRRGLELRLLWIAKSLKASGADYSRIEKAASLLAEIAGSKLDEAKKKEWKGSVILPLDDIVPGHAKDVMLAIGSIIDPA